MLFKLGAVKGEGVNKSAAFFLLLSGAMLVGCGSEESHLEAQRNKLNPSALEMAAMPAAEKQAMNDALLTKMVWDALQSELNKEFSSILNASEFDIRCITLKLETPMQPTEGTAHFGIYAKNDGEICKNKAQHTAYSYYEVSVDHKGEAALTTHTRQGMQTRTVTIKYVDKNASPIHALQVQYAARKTWWIGNQAFTACNESSDGPAGKLDEFIGFSDRPTTADFRDQQGKIYKVEVINPTRDGLSARVWTFYREKERCENEMINATRNLANKYR